MSKPVLILGANGGIGEATARRLADHNYPLILTARNRSTIDDLANELGATALAWDALNDTADDLVHQLDLSNGLAGFVYAIGSITLKPFQKASEDDFTTSYKLNVLAPAQLLQHLANPLKEAAGSVVLFSTVAVHQGFANHTVVASSKAAVEGLALSLATEWSPDVRVNVIAPSLMDTGIAEFVTKNEKMKQAIANMHAIPRIGQPDDAAAAAEYLISDDSSWMTGQVMHIDGGRSTIRKKS
jgi:NAD(P)-dependent dehydrogenase (short-subunit alcohol dehydrogenase family)